MNKRLNDVYMPLFRNTIGLENFLDDLFEKTNDQKQNTFPPYNIEKLSESEKYLITMAVAGFKESEIEITNHNRTLKISGNKDKDAEANVSYLHKGIAFRDFVRTFTLGEHVEVVNADLQDGMLKIYLENIIPEEAKPKFIRIKSN